MTASASGLSVMALAAALIAAGCGQPDSESPPERSPPPTTPDTTPVPNESLRERAERIVAFLQGDAFPDPRLLADSVALHVAPEGGAERKSVSSQELRDRSSWRVGRHILLPPGGLTELTTRVGSHFNCREVALASLYPELARYPHVGVLLEPPARESCLQTWNMTLVFDGSGEEPRLIAVVYDQWEW